MILERLKADVKRHEGFRSTVYADSLGVPTIGYGRNLRDVGISQEEADILLENDLQKAIEKARKLVPKFDCLSDRRQEVIVNMVFNLGYGGLSKFTRFRKAIEFEDWAWAAREMLDSRWAQQVGNRAKELSQHMEDG